MPLELSRRELSGNVHINVGSLFVEEQLSFEMGLRGVVFYATYGMYVFAVFASFVQRDLHKTIGLLQFPGLPLVDLFLSIASSLSVFPVVSTQRHHT